MRALRESGDDRLLRGLFAPLGERGVQRVGVRPPPGSTTTVPFPVTAT
ncbi:hypothetical protein ACFQE4_30855 [Streptomyces thermocoprophilus]